MTTGVLYQPSGQVGRDAVRTARADTMDALPVVEWRLPLPLASRARPSMPIGCLPETLGRFVENVSRSTQTPVELAGMLAIAACSTVLAKRLHVMVTPDWFEPLQTSSVVAMESGERKSAVFKLIIAPIKAYEKTAASRFERTVLDRDSERRVLIARIEGLEKRLAKTDDVDGRFSLEADLRTARDELAEKPEIHAPVLVLDDVTVEALAEQMYRHGGRMAVMSPEGGTFNIMAGTYSDGDARLDLYLKGHAGEDVRVNRMTRSLYIEDAALTLGLAVQPTVLEEAGANAAFRGKGLLARMLLVMPLSRIGQRELEPAPIESAVRAAYAAMISKMLEIVPTRDEDGYLVPHTLTLSPAAHAEFLAFRGRVEIELRDEGRLGSPSLRSWGSKLPGAVIRVAGILHAAEVAASGKTPGGGVIGLETMKSAIQLGEGFLLPHAIAAFGAMGADAGVAVAQRALGLIRRRGLVTVSRRSLQRELGLPKAEDIDLPLQILEEYGYLREVQTPAAAGKPGRKPSPEFAVNPYVFASQNNGEPPELIDTFDTTPATWLKSKPLDRESFDTFDRTGERKADDVYFGDVA